MIWSMADLKAARLLRARAHTPFWHPTRMSGSGIEQEQRRRFMELAKGAELVVHPEDILVEMEEPILATDMIASGDWYGVVTARWEPEDRPVIFPWLDEPARSLFGGSYTGLMAWDDTITLSVSLSPWHSPDQEINTVLQGWDEERRAWAYGEVKDIGQESRYVAGNGHRHVSRIVAG